jgi:probable phosphoglycerate mutase
VRDLWLVRHAETEWSRDRRHTGRTDLPLTGAGRAHAERLRPWIGAREWDAVLCSPLGRARETAELAGVGRQAVLRPDLLEVDYGEAEGITTEEVRERVPGWTLWTHGAPGGETLADVGARVDRVIAEAVAVPGTATCCASPTATSCACSPRAGSGWPEPPARTSRSARARSACSGSSATPGHLALERDRGLVSSPASPPPRAAARGRRPAAASGPPAARRP